MYMFWFMWANFWQLKQNKKRANKKIQTKDKKMMK